MKRISAAIAALVLVTGFATTASAHNDKVDIAGGYSFTRSLPDPGSNIPMGWFATVGFAKLIPQMPTMDIVADFSGGYKSDAGVDTNVHSFMFGPRIWWNMPMSPISVYGQFTFGGERSSASIGAASVSNSAFALAPGGGVDYKINDQWAARGGVNFRFANYPNAWGKDLQIVAGAVYHLK